MRLIEIIIVLLLSLYFISQIFFKQYKVIRHIFQILILIAVTLHLMMEGYRWQMIPLYLVSGGILVASFYWLLFPYSKNSKISLQHILLSILGLFIVALAALPAIGLPVPVLIEPTGPHSVGTITRVFIDDSRMELYSGEPNQPRELIIQIWYPGVPTTGRTAAPWLDNMDLLGPAISEFLGLPSFFLDHLALAATNAYPNIPVSEDKNSYPVLLFSHGWSGFRAQSTYLMEALASHGYVVASLEHTYGAILTVFPDGRVAPNNPNALPDNVFDDEYLIASNRLLEQWSGDLAFILDQITILNQSDPTGNFTGRLDLNNIGILGHSTGGGAAIEFCAKDTRCKVVVGLDAFLTPVSSHVLEDGLDQPGLMIFSEVWPSDRNNRLLGHLLSSSGEDLAALSISGTAHYDFSDLPLLSPLAPQLGLKGPLNGERALTIIRELSRSTLDQYLKGIPNPITDPPNKYYPEIQSK